MFRRLILALGALTGLASPLVAGDAPVSAAASAPAETARQLAALADLAEQAIASGVPDARGATLFHGTLGVIHGPERISQTRGIHAKLADGRWLVGLQTEKAASEVTVDEAALTQVAPEALIEGAGPYAKGWTTEALEQSLAQIVPADRDRIRAAASAAPVLIACGGNGASEPALVALHLVRLAAPCANDVAVIAAMAQAWNPRMTLLGPPAPLFGRRGGGFRNGQPRDLIAVPDAVSALRAGLIAHFRSRALSVVRAPGPGTTGPGAKAPEADAAAVLAALATAERLLPAEAAAARADLALLRGRAALPAVVAADAPLAERLAVWDGQLTKPGTEKKPDSMQGSHNRNGATNLVASEADLDVLFALLSDPRPCRWLDQGNARTLGDNALRAIAAICACDPRNFIRRDLAAPWTEAERAATATALGAWRTANAGRPLTELLVAAVPTMHPADFAQLVRQSPQELHRALLDAATPTWGQPPAGVDEGAVAAVIAAARGHAGMLAAITAWKVEGELALLLAAFQLTIGNQAPFDALFAAAFVDRGNHDQTMYQTVPLVRYVPTPERLQRLVEVLRGPLDQQPTERLVQMVMGGMNRGGHPHYLVQTWSQIKNGDREASERRAQVIPLALYALLLTDQRPLTPALRKQFDDGHSQRRMLRQGAAKPEAQPELAVDLRLADLAGAQFQSLVWQVDELLGNDVSQRADTLAVDLAKPLAERDRQLHELRRIIAEQLTPELEAAGLPNLAPPPAAAGGDDKALF